MLLVAYNVLLIATGPESIPTGDDGLRNRVVVERYFDNAVPSAVLVGSSVGARLAPDALQSNPLGPIYNLSLLGEGASSGIEAILRRPDLPKIVLVELSFGERVANATLLQQLTAEPHAALRRYFPAFRLENRPADLLVRLMARLLRRKALPATASSAEPEPQGLSMALDYWIARNAQLYEM